MTHAICVDTLASIGQILMYTAFFNDVMYNCTHILTPVNLLNGMNAMHFD